MADESTKEVMGRINNYRIVNNDKTGDGELKWKWMNEPPEWAKEGSDIKIDYTPITNIKSTPEFIDIDKYYNNYSIVSPKVVIEMIDENGNWKNIETYFNNSAVKLNPKQNNYFVSATIEDNGVKNLSLELYDRTFTSIQVMLSRAISAANKRYEEGDSMKDESGTLSLDFLRRNTSITSNLRIRYGFNDFNQPADEIQDYLGKIGSLGSSSRWVERTANDTLVLTKNDKSVSSTDVLSGHNNQTTILNGYEEFYITGVQSTLTESGIKYSITAVGSSKVKLQGYSFVQQYAQIVGTPIEVMSSLMNTLNVDKTNEKGKKIEEGFVRLVWIDSLDFIQEKKIVLKEKATEEGEALQEGETENYQVIDKEKQEEIINENKEHLDKLQKKVNAADIMLGCLETKGSGTIKVKEDDSDTNSIDAMVYVGNSNIQKKLYTKWDVNPRNLTITSNEKINKNNIEKYILYDMVREVIGDSASLDNAVQEKLFQMFCEKYSYIFKVPDIENTYDNSGKNGQTEHFHFQTLAKSITANISDYIYEMPSDEDTNDLFNDIAAAFPDAISVGSIENMIDSIIPFFQNMYCRKKTEDDYGSYIYYGRNGEVIIDNETVNIVDGETLKNLFFIKAANDSTDALYVIIPDYLYNIFFNNIYYKKFIYCLLKLYGKPDEVGDIKSFYNLMNNKDGSFGFQLPDEFNAKINKITLRFIKSLFMTNGSNLDPKEYFNADEIKEYLEKILGNNIDEYVGDLIYEIKNGISINANILSPVVLSAVAIALVFGGSSTSGEKAVCLFIGSENDTNDTNVMVSSFNTNGAATSIRIVLDKNDLTKDIKLTYDKSKIEINEEDKNALRETAQSVDDKGFKTLKEQIEHISKKIKESSIAKTTKVLEELATNEDDDDKEFIAKDISGVEASRNGSENTYGYILSHIYGTIYNYENSEETTDIEKKNDLIFTADGIGNLLSKLKNKLGELSNKIAGQENELIKNDITLSLGSAQKDGALRYKTLSSLLTDFCNQCPPYHDYEQELRLKQDEYDGNTTTAIDPESGEEVPISSAQELPSYPLTWNVIGYCENNKVPIVGFSYNRPRPISKIRKYCWGTGNAKAHCIKSMSISTNSEFAMLSSIPTLEIKETGGTNCILQLRNGKNGEEITSLSKQEVEDYHTSGFFRNVVTQDEKNKITTAMFQAVNKGTITLLGDPSLRFGGNINPYTLPIYIDINMQNETSTWSNIDKKSNDERYVTKSYLSGIYVVSKITHNISVSGYTTTLDIMRYPGIEGAVGISVQTQE